MCSWWELPVDNLLGAACLERSSLISRQTCWCSLYRLAKEAALHDPFASLAFTRPTGPVKSSPPLKNMSPGSASGSQQSSHTSPGPAPTNTSQTPTYKFPDNGGKPNPLTKRPDPSWSQEPLLCVGGFEEWMYVVHDQKQDPLQSPYSLPNWRDLAKVHPVQARQILDGCNCRVCIGS